MKPLIKICGIRELEHAQVAAEAGADLLGFVFVPVRRQITPNDARPILESVRGDSQRPPVAVGLFVNESAEKINAVAEQVDLDLVQLSGIEAPELAGQIDRPVIKAVRVEEGESLEDVSARIERYLQFSAGVLLDTHVAGQWGGTGVVGNWPMAARLAELFPIVLAGGLNPRNVADAIGEVQPAVVDVSSGVETDGRKDAQKIREFVSAAKRRQAAVDSNSPAKPLIEMISEMHERRASSRVKA
jgi:phosphoribosylanthranilate isomerase